MLALTILPGLRSADPARPEIGARTCVQSRESCASSTSAWRASRTDFWDSAVERNCENCSFDATPRLIKVVYRSACSLALAAVDLGHGEIRLRTLQRRPRKDAHQCRTTARPACTSAPSAKCTRKISPWTLDLSCTLASGSTAPIACISMGIVRTSAVATSTGIGGASDAFCDAALWHADSRERQRGHARSEENLHSSGDWSLLEDRSVAAPFKKQSAAKSAEVREIVRHHAPESTAGSSEGSCQERRPRRGAGYPP